MVGIAAERISQAVVADIDHQIKVFSTYRLIDNTFGFTRSKTRYLCVDQIVRLFVAVENKVVFLETSLFLSPFYEIVIDFISQLFTAVYSNNAERTNWNIIQNSFTTM